MALCLYLNDVNSSPKDEFYKSMLHTKFVGPFYEKALPFYVLGPYVTLIQINQPRLHTKFVSPGYSKNIFQVSIQKIFFVLVTSRRNRHQQTWTIYTNLVYVHQKTLEEKNSLPNFFHIIMGIFYGKNRTEQNSICDSVLYSFAIEKL